MGTFNLRGEILWLVDLSLLFQNTYLAPMTGQCPVILVPDEETSVGLAVFNIRGMAWLDAQQIRNASAVALEGMRPFVRGSFDLEEAPVLLLDPDAIIRSRPWTE
jgi:twitching motility protein PilI